MSIIQVEGITKKFNGEKGIFDLSFGINRGEVFGFIGPNGAGKTTTIRHLLGFMKPQSGRTSILDLDCWSQSKEVQKQLGYLPAEIAFPEKMTGMQLIRYLANMRKLGNLTKAEELIHRFQLDPSGPIIRMSKGTKQKIGIICAFMHDPEVLILDEPTSGLDPIMQSAFADLIREEKRQGRSILMSFHMFEEIEGTCDRIGMIKQGRMVSIVQTEEIRNSSKRTYAIEFTHLAELESIIHKPFVVKEINADQRRLIIEIDDARMNELLHELSTRSIKSFREIQSSLEEYFMSCYKGEYHHV
ncbi:ABC transporter ATP-binding protein [Paenibacillus lignilyticus]|uniref:ABC transporter ATP-binding protein n=1 Tax=Paenibacillus lignilyticus TaxID=1172615 RepID=A0ABS5CGX9_9BACL|nr:ABC transporter ATP-binding protein [Paenibacillus lignilyticus]MBP3965081.1 ABC transporter ATP-binding protein [Paenibacillus lignilyticus]